MWTLIKKWRIQRDEMGLLFRAGDFAGLLGPGTHLYLDPLNRVRVDVVAQSEPFLKHGKLDLIVKSGALQGRAEVLEIQDQQRALVWIDGRFARILGPGQHVYWTGLRAVRVEVVDIESPRFEHADRKVVLRSKVAAEFLDMGSVNRGNVGILFLDGRYVENLEAGPWAFWKGVADVRVVEVDLRDTVIDLPGQEIMSADKVTLRMNVSGTYRVFDPRKAVCAIDDFRQALYREAQLVLRTVIGAREIDTLLADKEGVSSEAIALLNPRLEGLGLQCVTLGIRDLILPGEMKDLLNRVIEAKKAAEANLITRREETAALRSQANTAKLLVENPTLMRLRELEVLEKLVSTGKLNVLVVEKGLSDRVLNLI